MTAARGRMRRGSGASGSRPFGIGFWLSTGRVRLAWLAGSGPIPAIHVVVRWRLKDLAWWVYEEFRISLDETTVGREVRKLGFRKLSARPRHYAQNEPALDDFKNVWPAPSARGLCKQS